MRSLSRTSLATGRRACRSRKEKAFHFYCRCKTLPRLGGDQPSHHHVFLHGQPQPQHQRHHGTKPTTRQSYTSFRPHPCAARGSNAAGRGVGTATRVHPRLVPPRRLPPSGRCLVPKSRTDAILPPSSPAHFGADVGVERRRRGLKPGGGYFPQIQQRVDASPLYWSLYHQPRFPQCGHLPRHRYLVICEFVGGLDGGTTKIAGAGAADRKEQVLLLP